MVQTNAQERKHKSCEKKTLKEMNVMMLMKRKLSNLSRDRIRKYRNIKHQKELEEELVKLCNDEFLTQEQKERIIYEFEKLCSDDSLNHCE